VDLGDAELLRLRRAGFDRVIDPAIPPSHAVDQDQLRVARADANDHGLHAFEVALDEFFRHRHPLFLRSHLDLLRVHQLTKRAAAHYRTRPSSEEARRPKDRL